MDDESYVPTDKIDFFNPIERYPDRVDKDALRPGQSTGKSQNRILMNFTKQTSSILKANFLSSAC